jgi:hypothetical protein
MVTVTTPGGTSGVIAYWSLDEASGQALDAHGTNHLTAVNAPGTAAGKVGTARTFSNAGGNYFTGSSNSDLQTGHIDFSFSVWVYPYSIPNSCMVVVKDDSSANRDFILHLLSANNAVRWAPCYIDGTYTLLDSANGTCPLNAWTHIVVGVDVLNSLAWMVINNGTRISLATGGKVPKASNVGFGIGNWLGPTGYVFDGRIDEVSFWKRNLSAADIAWLYNSGAGRSYASLSPTFTVVPGPQLTMIV